ncbi:hypothetical protein QQM79_07810 [Marinobacteraceae bacterium S3BR75-40.1]
MSAPIPKHLLKKIYVLAEVPRSTFSDAPHCGDATDTGKRHAFLKLLRKGAKDQQEPRNARNTPKEHVLNAAAWLQFSRPPEQPVALALLYRDQKGEFAVIVEEARASESGALMLSGEVRFKTRGPVEFMQACCLGTDGQYLMKVEEVYVQQSPYAESELKQNTA